jgi:acyl dehydratase
MAQNVIDVFNQTGEIVMTQKNAFLIARRGMTAQPRPRVEPVVGAALAPPPPLFATNQGLPLGAWIALGEETFTPDYIVGFAKAYDPQPFHTDEAAARDSHFGGLVASGWQTAATWMRSWIRFLRDAATGALKDAFEGRDLGPSPGVSDLKWPNPVYAGDKIGFSIILKERRPSARRDWDLVLCEGRGVNQHFICVLQFNGAMFWRSRT